jgi:hypothetical protein
VVFCTASNGAETEFPESALMSEAEWAVQAKGGARREIPYERLKQARHFLPAGEKLEDAACLQLLAKADRLSPGLLDFAAFTVAAQVLAEHKENHLVGQLSVKKCREMFDAAPAAVRARLLARLLDARPDALVSAARLGDNLLKAMVAKGLEARAAEFNTFQDRPRR